MLKVSTISTHASSQPNAPLLNSSIDDGLIELVPLLNETLFQMSDVSYPCLISMFLQHASDFVIYWIEVRAVGRPQKRCDEVRRVSCQQFNSFTCVMSGSAVLLECEVITGCVLDCRQQVFHQ
jgi:hypothetical protein